MLLMRKCLQETFLASESREKENAVLSFNWGCSALEGRREIRPSLLCFLPVVLRQRSALQKTHARHRTTCLSATWRGLDGARGGGWHSNV